MTDNRTKAGRTQFLLLTALFAAPLFATAALYLWPQLQPTGRTNYGEIVSPAQPVPAALRFSDAQGKPADAAVLKGKWSMVYVGAADCMDACRDQVFLTRQVRLLLNEKRDRVQRIYIAPDASALTVAQARLGEVQKDLIYLTDAGLPGQRAGAFFHSADPQAVYLVDPMGNWMMVYAGKIDYKLMLKDVKNLLKLSHIG